MSRTYTLRGLFVAAAVALLLLPLVALAGGLVGVAARNWGAINAMPEEVDAAVAAVSDYVAGQWEELGRDPAAFAAGLAPVVRDYHTALEVLDLKGQVRYASPEVVHGEYHPGGVAVQPTQRLAFVRRDGETVGVLRLWVTPAGALGRLNAALSAGLWAGAATLAALLLWVLRAIRRLVLGPLRELEAATAAVAAGALDFRVPATPVQELAALAQSFGDMRDRLAAALARQHALEDERRRFIAAVGHDLRTPLSSVRAFAEGLRDGLAREPDKAVRYGQVILDKTRELERLVADLFEYARLDLPDLAVRRQPVAAAAYLGAAAEAFRPEAEERGVRLAAGGPEMELQVDPELFARALNNLLENALRHTPEGGEVRLSWAPDPAGGAVVAVADTGEGIPPAELPHLFSPLHRTDRSRSRRSGGAGLGLAITARIAGAHGGSVRCESAPGAGARFEIRLP